MKGKIYKIIGLAGVDPKENKRAKRVGKMFEWPMILLAIYVLFVWQLLLTGVK